MKEPTKIEMFMSLVLGLPNRVKSAFCEHDIVPHFTVDFFLKEGWKRCSGVGTCRKCRADFSVSIAANDEERDSEHYLNNL